MDLLFVIDAPDSLKAYKDTSVAMMRAAQKRGREGVFRDYRLRIASVVRDYGMTERAEAPADSRATNG